MALALKWMTNAAIGGDAGTAAIAGFAVAVCAIAVLTLGHFAHIAYFELSEINTPDHGGADHRADQRLGRHRTPGEGRVRRPARRPPAGDPADAGRVLRSPGPAEPGRRHRHHGRPARPGQPVLLLLPLVAFPPLYHRQASAGHRWTGPATRPPATRGWRFICSAWPRAPDRPRSCESSGSRTRSCAGTASCGSGLLDASGAPSSGR